MKPRTINVHFVVYFHCAVEDEASVTTEPSVDYEQSRGHGQDIRRGRGEMRTGYGHDIGRGLGQGGPSGLPAGLPDDVGESDGMLYYGVFPTESIYTQT